MRVGCESVWWDCVRVGCESVMVGLCEGGSVRV